MDPFILPKNIYLCINAINGTLEITKIRYLFAKMGPLELQKLKVFIQQWAPILQKEQFLCINATINGAPEIAKIRYLFAKMGPLELQKLSFYTTMGPYSTKINIFPNTTPLGPLWIFKGPQ